jgi:hypothetical protein
MHPASEKLCCVAMPKIMEPDARQILHATHEAGKLVGQAQRLVRLAVAWASQHPAYRAGAGSVLGLLALSPGAAPCSLAGTCPLSGGDETGANVAHVGPNPRFAAGRAERHSTMNWGFRCLFGNCDGYHPQARMGADAPTLPISSRPGVQGCYSYNRPASGGGGSAGRSAGWVDLRVGRTARLVVTI